MIRELLASFRPSDAFDILATAVLIYSLLLLIRGTRAVQILMGIVFLTAVLSLAKLFHLVVLATLLRYVLVGTAVALPIVFQPELRRALESLGRGGIFGRQPAAHSEANDIAQAIASAAFSLARERIGALIAVEVASGLQDVIESGTRIDARLSSDILIAVFTPRSPLHDGAVIVSGQKLVAAGCVLPLAEGAAAIVSGRRLGTRHRAAIGLSEQTDAVIVVVSEETSRITVARGGKLSRVVDDEERLRKIVLACSRPAKIRDADTTMWMRVRRRVSSGFPNLGERHA